MKDNLNFRKFQQMKPNRPYKLSSKINTTAKLTWRTGSDWFGCSAKEVCVLILDWSSVFKPSTISRCFLYSATRFSLSFCRSNTELVLLLIWPAVLVIHSRTPWSARVSRRCSSASALSRSRTSHCSRLAAERDARLLSSSNMCSWSEI